VTLGNQTVLGVSGSSLDEVLQSGVSVHDACAPAVVSGSSAPYPLLLRRTRSIFGLS
jgi:hypothetical protein